MPYEPFLLGVGVVFDLLKSPFLGDRFLSSAGTVVTGKSLDSPEKENVEKMSENCPEALQTHNFRTLFAYVVGAFI